MCSNLQACSLVLALLALSTLTLTCLGAYLVCQALAWRPNDLKRRYPDLEWALVTGASSGLGRQIAIELAARGFHLVLVALPNAQLLSVHEELQELHPTQTIIQVRSIWAPVSVHTCSWQPGGVARASARPSQKCHLKRTRQRRSRMCLADCCCSPYGRLPLTSVTPHQWSVSYRQAGDGGTLVQPACMHVSTTTLWRLSSHRFTPAISCRLPGTCASSCSSLMPDIASLSALRPCGCNHHTDCTLQGLCSMRSALPYRAWRLEPECMLAPPCTEKYLMA
jgi:hypothetical protein